ncbi:hypothetical protein MT325_m082L [Paramecium bursaria chlorella virus MT325]|uniref:Uncharacterized protein m082L n=1 Tax=Paramecium bursaria Chlorella virus MT325 TaxID=346932 RepID=A7ITG2_PBCVM|nr:hypothetical protein MT325_m082L [Paramecium bursaria chlorella virus MT325]
MCSHLCRLFLPLSSPLGERRGLSPFVGCKFLVFLGVCLDSLALPHKCSYVPAPAVITCICNCLHKWFCFLLEVCSRGVCPLRVFQEHFLSSCSRLCLFLGQLQMLLLPDKAFACARSPGCTGRLCLFLCCV